MSTGVFSSSVLFKALIEVTSSSLESVAEMLDTGSADPTVRGDYGETYLHILAGNFDKEKVPLVIHLIYLLTDAGIDVNAADKVGNTVLHVALINKLHPNVLNALIKVGAGLQLKNKQGNDVMSLCGKSKRRMAILNWFHPGLADSIKTNDLLKVRQCLQGWCSLDLDLQGDTGAGITSLLSEGEEGAPISQLIRENRSTNVLVHSVIAGDVEILMAVLEKGKADVNIKDPTFLIDKEGITMIDCPLLLYAIYIKMWDTVEALMKFSSNIDVNVEIGGTSGRPLFHFILEHFHDVPGEIYKYIIRKANLDLIKDVQFDMLVQCWHIGYGSDVLHEFTQKGWSPFIKDNQGIWLRERLLENSLEKHRAEIEKGLIWVDSVVIKMATSGATEQLNELAESGYEYLDIATTDGVGIVDTAYSSGHAETAQVLTEAISFMQKRRQLSGAIKRGNLQQVKTLMSNSKLFTSYDRLGRTPLVTAVIFDRKFIVKHLIKQYKEAVNLVDSVGRTALHYSCALKGVAEIEKLLLSAGADPKIKDNKGKIAAEYRADMFSNFIQKERATDIRTNLFLLDGYLKLLRAIETGKLDKVQYARRNLNGHSLGHVEEKILNTFKLKDFVSSLWVAINAKLEEIGMYLLSEGANISQTRHINESPLSLEEEASQNGLSILSKAIHEKDTKERK